MHLGWFPEPATQVGKYHSTNPKRRPAGQVKTAGGTALLPQPLKGRLLAHSNNDTNYANCSEGKTEMPLWGATVPPK